MLLQEFEPRFLDNPTNVVMNELSELSEFMRPTFGKSCRPKLNILNLPSGTIAKLSRL